VREWRSPIIQAHSHGMDLADAGQVDPSFAVDADAAVVLNALLEPGRLVRCLPDDPGQVMFARS
jgi:hypothetical protein